MSEDTPQPPQQMQELDNEALHAAARVLNQYGGGPAREAYHASEFEATVEEYAQDRGWRDNAVSDLREAFEDQVAQISQLKSSYSELLKESQRDPLTKIYNREGFARALAVKLSHMKREGEQDAKHQFVMFDLDDFKGVNDTHGHSGGDVVLKTVARTVERELPNTLFGRFGGEEFMLFFENATPKEVTDTLARLNRLFRNTSFVRKNGEIIQIDKPVSACFGFAEMTARDDPVDALDQADSALYQSKEAPGKATITQYSPSEHWISKRKDDHPSELD